MGALCPLTGILMKKDVKDFKAPTDQPVKVFSNNFKHCAIITNKSWKSLKKELWNSAYGEGCISKDMVTNGFSKEQTLAVLTMDEKAYEVEVTDAMKILIDEGNPDKLDSFGRPKTHALGDILGKTPSQKLRNTLFRKLTGE